MSASSVWVIIGASVLATYMWRAIGMLVSTRLQSDSALSRWFTCVAYSVLAGLIARMIVVPQGVMADTPLIDKLTAVGIGLAVFVIKKRSTHWATGAAFLSFAILALLRNPG